MALKPDALEPEDKLGDWEIAERLGFGGGGLVYRARRAGLDFAVKICRHSAADGDHGTVQDARFEREYLALKKLPGMANVAAVYTYERMGHPLEGHAYFIQEFIPGSESITDWAARTSPTMAQVADIFRQLATTLDELEARGIRHRDLKPRNILMAGAVPKLIDFGIASMDGDIELTRHGEVPASAKYVSPEFCRWAQLPAPREEITLTPAAELHALGVVLYEALTGQYPWPGGELARRIVEEEPPPPSELNAAIPPELEAIVARLLRKNPAERPQSGGQLASELAVAMRSNDPRWLAQVRTKPGAEPAATPVRSGVRRTVLAAAALAVAVGAIVAGVAVGPRRAVAEVDPPDAGADHPPLATASSPPAEPAPQPQGVPVETVMKPPPPHKPKPGARLRAAALAAACVGAGCPGLQLRPEDTSWLDSCKADAVLNARQLNLPNEAGIIFSDSDTVKNLGLHKGAEVKDGPVEGVIAGVGFIVLGQLKVGGDVVSVRFDRLRGDDGALVPVCMVAYGIGDEPAREAGVPKLSGPVTAGFTLIGQNAAHVKIAR